MKHNPEPKEPTGDECNNHSKVYETETKVGYAIWYPQMGGYVGKAVAVMDKAHSDGIGGCVDCYVWHDGNFPFTEDPCGDSARGPYCIHHCDPAQFIEFGEALTRLNALGEVR